MARNYLQEGDTLTLVAPYDRTAGQAAKIGSIIAIAANDVLSGADGEFMTEGVFEVNKTSAQAWTQGVKLYWDDTAKEFTSVSTSNTLAGVATEAAANPSSTGKIRLNGSF